MKKSNFLSFFNKNESKNKILCPYRNSMRALFLAHFYIEIKFCPFNFFFKEIALMRMSWTEYFMTMCDLVSRRSTCLRRQVGAVIVRDNRILATGYNGAPSGLKHCDELGGCVREKLHIPSGERSELCRATHAEANAILQAAKYGIKLEGATLFCNTFPCSGCAKLIINVGIKKIVYIKSYNDELSKELISEANIEVEKYEAEDKE